MDMQTKHIEVIEKLKGIERYPRDYTDRQLYKQMYDKAQSHIMGIQQSMLKKFGGKLPDSGCDAYNSRYLAVLAALDIAEDICEMNCDDYAYENLDLKFNKIRKVMNERIVNNVNGKWKIDE